MKRRELEREGKAWIKEGIITEEQLQQILDRKQETGPNYLIVLFAVLLTGLGFLTFIMSDWAREPHLSRVLIILFFTFFFYGFGDVMYRKNKDMYGISFILLGYIVFGSGLLLVIDIYQVIVFSAWPLAIWTFVGFMLYIVYRHPLILSVALLIGTAGQLYSGMDFFAFNWVIFILTVIGAGYFAYQEKKQLFYYLLAISFSLQSIVFIATIFEHYYWYLIPALLLYISGVYLAKEGLQTPIGTIALYSVFLFGMYQTFLLQDEWYAPQIPEFELSFIIVWLVSYTLAVFLKWSAGKRDGIIDLILFLPIVFMPFAYILSLIVLFIFSLGWVFIGYKKNNQQEIRRGTVAFLLSTLTVYIQYAWDALDKSLFFFVGGILLFLISFIMESQRRKLTNNPKGSDRR